MKLFKGGLIYDGTGSGPYKGDILVEKVYINGVNVLEPYQAQPTENSVVVQLTGSGVQTYELYVNGAFHSKVTVDFIPYG